MCLSRNPSYVTPRLKQRKVNDAEATSEALGFAISETDAPLNHDACARYLRYQPPRRLPLPPDEHPLSARVANHEGIVKNVQLQP
jgi:hypothetical protein